MESVLVPVIGLGSGVSFLFISMTTYDTLASNFILRLD